VVTYRGRKTRIAGSLPSRCGKHSDLRSSEGRQEDSSIRTYAFVGASAALSIPLGARTFPFTLPLGRWRNIRTVTLIPHVQRVRGALETQATTRNHTKRLAALGSAAGRVAIERLRTACLFCGAMLPRPSHVLAKPLGTFCSMGILLSVVVDFVCAACGLFVHRTGTTAKAAFSTGSLLNCTFTHAFRAVLLGLHSCLLAGLLLNTIWTCCPCRTRVAATADLVAEYCHATFCLHHFGPAWIFCLPSGRRHLCHHDSFRTLHAAWLAAAACLWRDGAGASPPSAFSVHAGTSGKRRCR